jgi:mannose-6-phosphate isomerase-like protein (cupin superfamily)
MTPKPAAGQLWNLFDFEAKGIEFTTMIGTYLWPNKGQQPPDPPPATRELSLHFWSVKEKDEQTPHAEDEAYFVLKGRGTLTIDGQAHRLRPGDLIFVPKGAHHQFTDFEQEGLTMLVIFGPNFTG